jgi:hypothetical protein
LPRSASRRARLAAACAIAKPTIHHPQLLGSTNSSSITLIDRRLEKTVEQEYTHRSIRSIAGATGIWINRKYNENNEILRAERLRDIRAASGHEKSYRL